MREINSSVVVILAMVMMLAGCAVNQPGSRTVHYGLDGLTVTSETLDAPADSLVEVEKEKSVQTCWKEYGKANKAIVEAVQSNPMVSALLKQTEALNNALSLIKTGKNYNPCPSSTNSMDADIAESAMYTSIWHDAIGAAKFGLGMWLGYEAVDSIVGGLSKAGGMALSATGEGSTINLSESANKFTLGDTLGGSTVGDLFNRPIDNSVENILPEPKVDAALMTATP